MARCLVGRVGNLPRRAFGIGVKNVLTDPGITIQLFGPGRAHAQGVAPQRAVRRIIYGPSLDHFRHMEAFLPGSAILRLVAPPVTPPGKLAAMTLLVAALLDHRADPGRPTTIRSTVENHMRDGNLADHRLTPGLVINVLRQAMNIWAVTRLFSLAQAFTRTSAVAAITARERIIAVKYLITLPALLTVSAG